MEVHIQVVLVEVLQEVELQEDTVLVVLVVEVEPHRLQVVVLQVVVMVDKENLNIDF